MMRRFDASFLNAPAEPSLQPLIGYVKGDLERVNLLTAKEIQSPVPKIPAVALHILSARGKQVRVLLTLACAHVCGYTGDRHIQLATAMDLIQTATLLHDDVVDESPLRRGIPAAHTLFGNSASVLVGDFLLTRAFDLVIQVQSWDIMQLLNHMTSRLTQGEVMEIDFLQNLDVTQEQYLEMISAKTACFFSAACELGGLLTHQTPALQQALYQFGFSLGMAFQLVDDALDYIADPGVLGKKVGQDFFEGKVTLPALLAYQQGTPAQRAHWEMLFQQTTRTEEDLKHVQSYLQAQQSLKQVFEKAKGHVEIALKALENFSPSPLREALEEAAYFMIRRGF
ncbi:MAG: polyprenyl synthetase family protein [Alphaproteobacteria bacterium]